MLNRNLLLMTLMTGCLLFMVVGALSGCPTHTPPDTPGDDPLPFQIDPDAVVDLVADACEEIAVSFLASPEDFDECIAGVILQGTADYTRNVAIPIKQAVEAGDCSGYTDSVVIDPSPCVGLPGTPEDVEGVEAAKAEVADALSIALPLASSVASFGAATARGQGDTPACTALQLISDLLEPAGELATGVLVLVEEPGSPFVFPGASWDCSSCL